MSLRRPDHRHMATERRIDALEAAAGGEVAVEGTAGKVDWAWFDKFVKAFTDDWAGHLPKCGYTDEHQVCGCAEVGVRLGKVMIAYAAAVRHEHGQRIAEALDKEADEYERLRYLGDDIYRSAARIARDLSPPL